MKNSSTLIAFISAFALHIIIGGLLLISVDFSLPREKPKTPIIEASVVNQKLFDDLALRKKEKARAEQRKKDRERKAIKLKSKLIQLQEKLLDSKSELKVSDIINN